MVNSKLKQIRQENENYLDLKLITHNMTCQKIDTNVEPESELKQGLQVIVRKSNL